MLSVATLERGIVPFMVVDNGEIVFTVTVIDAVRLKEIVNCGKAREVRTVINFVVSDEDMNLIDKETMILMIDKKIVYLFVIRCVLVVNGSFVTTHEICKSTFREVF